jgi:hypothetical protein
MSGTAPKPTPTAPLLDIEVVELDRNPTNYLPGE